MIQRTLFASTALLLLAGCGSSIDTTAMKHQADRIYGFVANYRTDDLLDMYDAEFYEFVKRDEWREALTGIFAVLGEYQSHEYMDSIMTASVKKGSTVTLIYEVTYSNHVVVEQLTFRVDDEPLLIRHQFNTDAELPRRHATVGESEAE